MNKLIEIIDNGNLERFKYVEIDLCKFGLIDLKTRNCDECVYHITVSKYCGGVLTRNVFLICLSCDIENVMKMVVKKVKNLNKMKKVLDDKGIEIFCVYNPELLSSVVGVKKYLIVVDYEECGCCYWPVRIRMCEIDKDVIDVRRS